MANLSRCIRFHALRSPEQPALIYEGLRISYGELWRRTLNLGGWMRSRGLDRGDAIGVLMKNSAAFIEIALAASHIGAVLVPINFRLSPDEVDYILRDSGAKLLLCDEEFAGTASTTPTTLLGAREQRDSSNIGTGDATEMAPVGPDDLLRIMYTSGTTDRPKGVMHSYANFYAKSADQIVALNLSAATRLLVAGPLYHVGAFDLPGVAVLWVGGLLCIQRDFEPMGVLGLIQAERLNGAWLAPIMSSALLSGAAGADFDLNSLEWAIGGGERTPEARIVAFSEVFPNARYIDAYGLTETCGGDTMMEPGREMEKIGSTGRALSQVDLEIRDDAGGPVPTGQEGEVCLRGAKVTKGYWRAPQKTADSFFGDWFRTGDVGYLDAEGFLFLTDRKKDMIISGGENIASSEVERVIYELPQISDAAVVGVPDARWGERPVAFVVLHAGEAIDARAIKDHCRARLARFKVPDRIYVESALPRSASGKVLKRVLRDRLAGSES